MSSIARMIPFISLYLYPKDVFLSLSLVCKEWHKKLSGNYLSFWLRTNLSFQDSISLESAKLKWPQFFKQEILNFNPWISTSGMSTYEYGNPFQSMRNNNWINDEEYNLVPFVKNSCCAAYYAERFKSHSFYGPSHHNLYYTYQPGLGQIPAELSDFEKNCKFDLGAISSEDDYTKFKVLEAIFNLSKLKFASIWGEKNRKILYPYDPCRAELAFVNKIAIARPFYSKSSSKT